MQRDQRVAKRIKEVVENRTGRAVAGAKPGAAPAEEIE
jgi:hypothetical protein